MKLSLELTVCDNCYIVVSNEAFPTERDRIDDYGNVNIRKFTNERSNEWLPFIECPCCQERIILSEEDYET